MTKLDRKTDDEIEMIKDHFGNHPLLFSCQQAFTRYQANMAPLLLSPEEVFYESAVIIDQIMGLPPSEVETYVNGLWNKLRIKFSKWEKTSSPENLDMACSSIFYTVAMVMHLHDSIFYNYDVNWWLFGVVQKEIKKINYEDTQRVFYDLLEEGDEIEEWINNEYDGNLYNEIDAVKKRKDSDNKSSKSRVGRKAVDCNKILASFSYLPEVDYRTERLQAVFDSLNKKYIACDKKVFLDLFQGQTTTKKILWKGSIVELKYLISKLAKLKYITWPSNYTIWQMVCARFQISEKTKQAVAEGLNGSSNTIKDLIPNQFTKGGKMPRVHNELDKVIKILYPKIEFGPELDAFIDNHDPYEHDAIHDTNDALANGLNTDIKI